MNRTYLFVPPEERSEVEALGATWDSDLKCWYVDGEPSSSLARWSSTSEDEEFSIISNDAYVARTGITSALRPRNRGYLYTLRERHSVRAVT